MGSVAARTFQAPRADAGAFRRAPTRVAAAAEASGCGRRDGSRGDGSPRTPLAAWVVPVAALAVPMFASRKPLLLQNRKQELCAVFTEQTDPPGGADLLLPTDVIQERRTVINIDEGELILGCNNHGSLRSACFL